MKPFSSYREYFSNYSYPQSTKLLYNSNRLFYKYQNNIKKEDIPWRIENILKSVLSDVVILQENLNCSSN